MYQETVMAGRLGQNSLEKFERYRPKTRRIARWQRFWQEYFKLAAKRACLPNQRIDRMWQQKTQCSFSLPKWFIQLFSKEYDTVLDPFMGSGTTNVVAETLLRHSIDIVHNYWEIAKNRCSISENAKGEFDETYNR